MFYIQLDAVLHGVDANLSFYLVRTHPHPRLPHSPPTLPQITALNAASIPGRLLPTFLADRFGIFNIQIFCGAAAGAVVLGMLGIGSSPAPPIVLAILYGFFSGAYVSLSSPALISLANSHTEIGARIGMGFLVTSFAALTGKLLVFSGPTHRTDISPRRHTHLRTVTCSLWLLRPYHMEWGLHRIWRMSTDAVEDAASEEKGHLEGVMSCARRVSAHL